MNLHEYQAKQLLASYHLPVPDGEAVFSIDEALAAYESLECTGCVVKAQVHAGGRGKAGGVKLVDSQAAMVDAVRSMLGTRLVTYQTDKHGQPVHGVLIEKTSNISRELYLGAVVDRASQRVVFMASTEGGVDIETVAAQTPEKIFKIVVDPMLGVQPYQARMVGFKLGLDSNQLKQFSNMMLSLGKLFVERDLSLLEINPLVITGEGQLLCLDAKVNIDENALFRQRELAQLRDVTQEDERVNHAHEWELNYVPLEGNIGCMVNGAGLAMATMDIIKLHGGQPANFLDVGGGATRERVTEAFKIILSDDSVKAVLVNIFGGIVRCDLIAEGIISAIKDVQTTLPIVVRLEGNNAAKGADILRSSSLNVIAAESLTDAAIKVVESASGDQA